MDRYTIDRVVTLLYKPYFNLLPSAMSVPPFSPMTQLMTPELLISSLVPEKRPLSDFCNWVLHTPEFSNAPVHQVSCNRSGVHDFVLVACRVALSVDATVRTVWLRLERHPSEGGSGLMSKPNAAKDTIQVGKNPDMLTAGQKYASRGHFAFYSEDRPATTLVLRHIAEMLLCFTRYSSSYSLFKTNCRWLCYALLECLKQCHQCYGGNWIGSPVQRCDNTTDTRTALEAKDVYLRERHPSCCMYRQSSTPNLPPVRPVVNMAPNSINPGIRSNINVNHETHTGELNCHPRYNMICLLIAITLAAVTDAAADIIYSAGPPHPPTRPTPQPAQPDNSAYSHSHFHSPHRHPPVVPRSVHQPSSGYGAPLWDTAPLPPSPYPGYHPYDALRAQDHENAHIPPQARSPNWQSPTLSSTYPCFPSPVNTDFHHPHCSHQIAQGPRNSTYQPRAACSHTHASSSARPQHQHPPSNFCTHQAPPGHIHRCSPPEVYSIPENGYTEIRDNWNTGYQSLCNNSTAHGSDPGRPNHRAAHTQFEPLAIPTQGPFSSVQAQVPGYGPNPYHPVYSRSPTIRGVNPHQQSRPQPGRGWTEEVWMSHVGEVPLRTESPAPLEEGYV